MDQNSNSLKTREQFEKVFVTYYAALVVYLRTLGCDTGTAEDVVQQVFCELWNKRKEITIRTNLRAFLFRTVRNAALNHLTRDKKASEELPERLSDNSRMQDDMDIIQRDKLLYEIIEKLPEQRKHIFRNCYLYDRKYKDVADELGISVNTVKTQMGRALQNIKDAAAELKLLSFYKDIY